MNRLSLALAALGAAAAFSATPAAAQQPVADCTFCGAWTLAPDVTIALQDVTLGHATLVYDAIQTITVEMAFAPEGSACGEWKRERILAMGVAPTSDSTTV